MQIVEVRLRRSLMPELDNDHGRALLRDYWRASPSGFEFSLEDLRRRMVALGIDPSASVHQVAAENAFATAGVPCRSCGNIPRLLDRTDLAIVLADGLCGECLPVEAVRRRTRRRMIEQGHAALDAQE